MYYDRNEKSICEYFIDDVLASLDLKKIKISNVKINELKDSLYGMSDDNYSGKSYMKIILEKFIKKNEQEKSLIILTELFNKIIENTQEFSFVQDDRVKILVGKYDYKNIQETELKILEKISMSQNLYMIITNYNGDLDIYENFINKTSDLYHNCINRIMEYERGAIEKNYLMRSLIDDLLVLESQKIKIKNLKTKNININRGWLFEGGISEINLEDRKILEEKINGITQKRYDQKRYKFINDRHEFNIIVLKNIMSLNLYAMQKDKQKKKMLANDIISLFLDDNEKYNDLIIIESKERVSVIFDSNKIRLKLLKQINHINDENVKRVDLFLRGLLEDYEQRSTFCKKIIFDNKAMKEDKLKINFEYEENMRDNLLEILGYLVESIVEKLEFYNENNNKRNDFFNNKDLLNELTIKEREIALTKKLFNIENQEIKKNKKKI